MPEETARSFKVGDEVRLVGGDLYLGRRLPPGLRGRIIEEVVKDSLFRVQVEDGRTYYLAPAEMELVPRLELIKEIRDRYVKLALPEKLLGEIDAWLEKEIEKEKE